MRINRGTGPKGVESGPVMRVDKWMWRGFVVVAIAELLLFAAVIVDTLMGIQVP